MTKEEFRAAREKLGLTQSEMAKALRLRPDNGAASVRAMEAGRKAISGPVSLAVEYLLIQSQR
jgi:DNA-binding XRE family transcriptional regulator